MDHIVKKVRILEVFFISFNHWDVNKHVVDVQVPMDDAKLICRIERFTQFLRDQLDFRLFQLASPQAE